MTRNFATREKSQFLLLHSNLDISGMSAVVIIYSIETVQLLLSPIVMEYYRARIHCERKTKPEGANFQVVATFK